MSRQVSLAHALIENAGLGRTRVHFDVRHNPDFLDRTARRGVIKRCGQTKPRAAIQGVDGLHRTLPERGHPHDQGSPVVLKSTGHDLGSARAASVDQRHDGIGRFEGARPSGIVLTQGLVPTLGVDDQSLAQPVVGHGHRLIEQSAGVVTQIDHHAL